MATTKEMIREWLERAYEGDTHMVVVCDQFDYEDYPIFITQEENIRDRVREINAKNMQVVMEVYNLSIDLDEQVNSSDRVFNY